MTASVGSTIEGSGTSSIRTSPASYINVARIGRSSRFSRGLFHRSTNPAKLRGRLVPGIDRAPQRPPRGAYPRSEHEHEERDPRLLDLETSEDQARGSWPHYLWAPPGARAAPRRGG